MSDTLTPKQRAFCKHYIENSGDVIEAAKNAGYTKPEIQGTENLEKTKIMEYINKLKNKKIEEDREWERRKADIDQGHKMIRAIDLTIAEQGGAIAAIWHAHKTTPYFTARPDHWKRNGEVYVFKNSDVVEKGLVKKGHNPWLEDIPDPPAFLFNCVCYWEFIYSFSALAKIAPDRITQKGRDLLNSVKVKPLTRIQPQSKTNGRTNSKGYGFLTIILIVISIIYFIFIRQHI